MLKILIKQKYRYPILLQAIKFNEYNCHNLVIQINKLLHNNRINKNLLVVYPCIRT